MHPSAATIGKRFFDIYAKSEQQLLKIVEIGSQNVNGGLRDLAPDGSHYIGLDFADAQGVDIVLKDPYQFPLEDNVADIIVSSSVFEHAEFFWLTFLEGMRILKDGGLFYINAPANGYFHSYPHDCWRFYPDSANALCRWGQKHGYDVKVIESFTAYFESGVLLNDQVIVFAKGTFSNLIDKISDTVPAYNIAIVKNGFVENFLNLQEANQAETFVMELAQERKKVLGNFPENEMITLESLSYNQQKIFLDFFFMVNGLMVKLLTSSKKSQSSIEQKPTIKEVMNSNHFDKPAANFDPQLEPWRFLDAGHNNHLGSLNPNYAPRGLIDLLDTPPALALDIGCFIGATGAYMKQKWPQCRVVGVEPVAEAAAQARTKVDAVFEGFFEDMPVGEAGVEPGKVDLAVFADVLEHMRHPWGALRHIRDWLSPNGAVLVSLPNIRNLNVLKDLVGNGTFNYKPAGILDITHIRFFTRSDALKMFEQTGYAVEKMGINMDHSLINLLQQIPKEGKFSFDVGSKMRLNDVDYAEAEELCALQFWFLLRAKN